MHDDTGLVEDRVEKLRERVAAHVHTVVAPLTTTAWRAPGEPVDFATARRGDYRPFERGTWWGPAWSTWWLRVAGQVPVAARTRALRLRVDLGFVGDWAGNQSEAMVYTATGRPLKGVNPMNRTVALGEPAPGGLLDADGRLELVLEAAANPNLSDALGRVTSLGDRLTAGDEPLWRYGGAEIVSRDEDGWLLHHDLEVLDGLLRQLPAESTHRARLLRTLEDAADVWDAGPGPRRTADARAVLAPLLTGGANASAQRMIAVGHAHIDSAWLWPLRETRRKVLRTFANVTALVDEYPDFHFACTSAQHYQWLKEASDEVFQRVRSAIAAGRWHVVGGMWVEPDTNLPGGEALVRQFTSGLRWMRRELGVRPDCLWLPDSFGYTAALPQIARLAGMRWFFTQKLSWNRTNTLPHHTFWWEGIDGTRIWTHFPPVDCYDSVVSPEEVLRAERTFAEKGRARTSLLPFGYGDGGGGPTDAMMERVRRFADLEDAPQLVPGSPEDYRAAAVAEYPDAPTWTGELYLEFHRGVYTTQHALKQGNRRAEHALHALEWLATVAARRDSGYAYPAERLETLWQRTLLLQFHDILPGSSIAWVNREAAAEYQALTAELAELTAQAWRAAADDAAGASVVNASPVPRREVIEAGGRLVLVQAGPHSIPTLADAAVEPARPVTLTRQETGTVLDNGRVRLRIDDQGCVAELTDLAAERDLLLPGTRGNVLRLHPDHPSSFDAWELEAHYRHQGTELLDVTDIVVVRDDPLRAEVRIDRVAGDSRLSQTVALDADADTVDFALWIDWRERERVLKVGFPLAVRAAHATAEIQFGHLDRPVAANTSWDAARFETSGHRWLLLAEPGYAVALANESTYGHDVRPAGGSEHEPTSGVVAGLTLLRAPQSPDPLADLGEHTLRYSLTVGADLGGAHRAGFRLNQPLQVRPGRVVEPPLVRVLPGVEGDRAGVDLAVVDTVKEAFDGSGDLVVRLHEAAGARSRVRLRCELGPVTVREVDLLEEPVAEPTQPPSGPLGPGDDLPLTLRPFQILTLRFARTP